MDLGTQAWPAWHWQLVVQATAVAEVHRPVVVLLLKQAVPVLSGPTPPHGPGVVAKQAQVPADVPVPQVVVPAVQMRAQVPLMHVVPLGQQKEPPPQTCCSGQHAPAVQACCGGQHTPLQVVTVVLLPTHAPPQKVCPEGQVQPVQVELAIWPPVQPETQVRVPPEGVQGCVPEGQVQVQAFASRMAPPVQLGTQLVVPVLELVHSCCPAGQEEHWQVVWFRVAPPVQLGTQVPLPVQKVCPLGQAHAPVVGSQVVWPPGQQAP